MKVLFDALGAPPESGGMRLHATEVIRSWHEEFPEDELTVVGPEWVRNEFRKKAGIRVVSWPNINVVARAIGQQFVTAASFFLFRNRVVISLSPIVSSLVPQSRAICYQHDWRHLVNPHEFGWPQRLYRKLWQLSAHRAAATICISDKTRRETLEVSPKARVQIIENGRDHARRWKLAAATDRENRTIVTFGHHNNKRPDLVIEAFSHLSKDKYEDVSLVVLGARNGLASDLKVLADKIGVLDRCQFPGFVSESEYQQLVSKADVLVMASSDEGFGLPITEAQFFGVPAVLTADSGVAHLHGADVIVRDALPSPLADGLRVALDVKRTRGPVVLPHTWAAVASQLRKTTIQLVQEVSSGRRNDV